MRTQERNGRKIRSRGKGLKENDFSIENADCIDWERK